MLLFIVVCHVVTEEIAYAILPMGMTEKLAANAAGGVKELRVEWEREKVYFNNGAAERGLEGGEDGEKEIREGGGWDKSRTPNFIQTIQIETPLTHARSSLNARFL